MDKKLHYYRRSSLSSLGSALDFVRGNVNFLSYLKFFFQRIDKYGRELILVFRCSHQFMDEPRTVVIRHRASGEKVIPFVETQHIERSLKFLVHFHRCLERHLGCGTQRNVGSLQRPFIK